MQLLDIAKTIIIIEMLNCKKIFYKLKNDRKVAIVNKCAF